MGYKKTQYGGDVVMFLPNKIITNNKLNYPQKNVRLAHGFKTLHMVLKPCARPSKQLMVLLYMVQEGLAHGFKTMSKGLLNNPRF